MPNILLQELGKEVITFLFLWSMALSKFSFEIKL